jgi:putative transposase
MKQQFNMDEALELVKQGARIDGKDGVLAPLIKQLTEAVLEAEIESHLSTEINNRKNGKSSKTMKSSVGTFDLDVPHDRNSSFEPEIVKNIRLIYQNN